MLWRILTGYKLLFFIEIFLLPSTERWRIVKPCSFYYINHKKKTLRFLINYLNKSSEVLFYLARAHDTTTIRFLINQI